MAGSGWLSISGQVYGTPSSLGVAKGIAFPVISTSSAAYSEEPVTLSSGNNTLTLPTSTTVVVLVPSTSNSTAWGLGTGGATSLGLTSPAVVPVPSGTTSLVVYAASSMTITVVTL
jgi:hypothetical protein